MYVAFIRPGRLDSPTEDRGVPHFEPVGMAAFVDATDRNDAMPVGEMREDACVLLTRKRHAYPADRSERTGAIPTNGTHPNRSGDW